MIIYIEREQIKLFVENNNFYLSNEERSNYMLKSVIYANWVAFLLINEWPTDWANPDLLDQQMLKARVTTARVWY